MIDLLKKRRTQYSLGRNVALAGGAIDSLVREAIRQSPSPFNSQSSRALILFHGQSDKFWEIVREALRKIVPAEDFAATNAKVESFSRGIGTILFFEDEQTVQGLQAQFPIYADNFPVWSEHASGMAQLAVWTALANVGIGASLQHYSPLVDAAVAETWNVSPFWKLKAQMPFGSNEAPFPEKSYIPDEIRFHTFV